MSLAPRALSWLGSAGRAQVVVAIIGVAALFVVIVFQGLNPAPSHDEYQYVAAAVLAGERTIYRDFFYSQTPYFVLFLSRWLDLIPDSSIYGSARVFNIIWSLSFFIVLGWFLWCVSRAPLLVALLLAGLATSPLLEPAVTLVRNDTMPLFFMTAALACMAHVSSERPGASAGVSFLAGLFAALAFGTKQSYAFLPVTLAIFALVAPTCQDWRGRAIGLLAPLCLGGLLGGLPIIVVANDSFPNFLYDTVEYHSTADPLWFTRVGWLEQTRVLSRLIIFGELAFDFYTLSLLLVVGLCSALIMARGHGRIGGVDSVIRNAAYLSILGIVLSAATLLGLAKSIFAQYLAPILVLAEIACAAMVGTARSAIARFKPENGALVTGSATALVGLGLVVSILTNPAGGIARLGCIWHDCEWAPGHVQRVASRLNEILGPGSRELKIATLMSIYPLEAGFGIYDELAGAPFFYRVNDMLPKERLRSLKGVAPDEVATWLADRGATAVLTGYTSGYDADLEAGFVRFARDHGLVPVPIDLHGGYKQSLGSTTGSLWVAPSLIESAVPPLAYPTITLATIMRD